MQVFSLLFFVYSKVFANFAPVAERIRSAEILKELEESRSVLLSDAKE
jgi:hypothetical protein